MHPELIEVPLRPKNYSLAHTAAFNKLPSLAKRGWGRFRRLLKVFDD